MRTWKEVATFKRNNNLRSEHEVYEESCTLFMALQTKMNKARPNDPEILYVESLKTHVINDEGEYGMLYMMIWDGQSRNM